MRLVGRAVVAAIAESAATFALSIQ